MIDETVERIEQMETHSSSVVALESLEALSELLDREYETSESFVRAVERNSRALRQASPSHPTLFHAQRSIRSAVTENEFDSVSEAKAALRTAVEAGVEASQTTKRQAAAAAAEHIQAGDRVLTHDYSTTVIEAFERALADGRRFEVVVTEARPRCLGRKTARYLARETDLPITLGVDSAAGELLRECDRVFVGMTCIVEGVLYNRVGTFPIVAAANRRDVPAYAVGASGKVVPERFVFENDFRPSVEVLREPIDGVTVENPAYDATPTSMLEGVITENDHQSA